MALYTIPSTGSGVGTVKSVQRGSYTPPNGGSNYSISISAINPAKSLVFLYGGYSAGGTSASIDPTPQSLTSTVLTVYGPFYYGSQWTGFGGYWQIIEYV